MLMSTSVGLYSSIHSPSSMSLPLGLSSTSFTKMLSPAVTDDVSSSSVSLATVELLRSSIASKERGDSISSPPGCCCCSPSPPGCCCCSPSPPGCCCCSPSPPGCCCCSPSPPGCCCCCCCCCSPSSLSVTLPTKSIMSLTVVILDNVFWPTAELDNVFWPTAEGMPLIIGSSNNAKTVSSFIDIIYSLINKKRYREY